MINVVFHRLVQHDLREALRYYDSQGGPALGDRFFKEAEGMIQKIAADPTRFPPVDEGIRRANFNGFPYHFLYESHSSGIRVFVLRHHKRKPDFGLRRMQ